MGIATSIRTLAGAVLTLGLLAACHGGEEPAEDGGEQAARAVTVVAVARHALEGGVMASGQLVPREEAAVSAEVTGYRVARVLADVGDQVSAGEILVELDDTLLTSQILQQRALVEQAQVAARQADAQAARVAGLEGTGALPSEQIEQRRFQAESASAAAAAQAAGLRDLETRLSKLQVRAPVGGMVLERNVRPGELSGAAGGPMFRIARGNLIELQAQVAESDLPAIQAGSPAVITLPDGGTVQGTVRVIEPTVAQDSRLGLVRVALPVRSDLRAGGHATAQFNDLRADMLSVPETAVNYDADGASVFVVDDENRVVKVPVETGRRGGGYVELLEGPEEGARVLVSAGSFVLEGDIVNPVTETATAGAGDAGAP
jgi:HlyD family secretion protein